MADQTQQEKNAHENGERPIYPDPMRGASQSYSNQNPHALPEGLTKREYFAGLAMQGLLTNQRLIATEEELAKASIEVADELLKQLAK